jgi:uncharacterized protein YqgQ
MLNFMTLFLLQKQNVEKAKATLLNENLDGSTSATDNKQSDHLLMVIAYDKWSRLLLQHGAKSARQFCHSFYLNSTVMHMIRFVSSEAKIMFMQNLMQKADILRLFWTFAYQTSGAVLSLQM